MIRFAHALPGMRRQIATDLAVEGYAPRRVLACSVRLLDRGFFRIGSEGYAEDNGTYGLATMRREHVSEGARGELRFDYPAKGGKQRVQSVVDPEVAQIVMALKRRRGGDEQLLAYKEGGRWRGVRSEEINEYVRERTGGDFTAKDFRTWNATVLAALALAVAGPVAHSKSGRQRAIARAVKEVSHYLGNTPAVCRASYIDPRVFDRYRGGLTISGALHELGADADLGAPSTQGAVEAAVLDLITGGEESPAVERVKESVKELARAA
jgi:DNA topoisomerase-1